MNFLVNSNLEYKQVEQSNKKITSNFRSIDEINYIFSTNDQAQVTMTQSNQRRKERKHNI